MSNTTEIVELEQKWIKYRLKKKIKIYFFLILFCIIIFSIVKLMSIEFNLSNYTQNSTKDKIITSAPPSSSITTSATIDKNTTISEIIKIDIPTKTTIENNITNQQNNLKIDTVAISTKEPVIKKESYSFRLEPVMQESELFATSGSLNFNPPINGEKVISILKEKSSPLSTENSKLDPVDHPIKSDPVNLIKQKKVNITIGTKKIDTITYLKEKFYSTSNIVFALMLAEEYYKINDYEESLKWALTANDINYLNDKSWYWFAKSKVKMNQNNDAIRALKSFLLNNRSAKLQSLLIKIETGDMNE